MSPTANKKSTTSRSHRKRPRKDSVAAPYHSPTARTPGHAGPDATMDATNPCAAAPSTSRSRSEQAQHTTPQTETTSSPAPKAPFPTSQSAPAVAAAPQEREQPQEQNNNKNKKKKKGGSIFKRVSIFLRRISPVTASASASPPSRPSPTTTTTTTSKTQRLRQLLFGRSGSPASARAAATASPAPARGILKQQRRRGPVPLTHSDVDPAPVALVDAQGRPTAYAYTMARGQHPLADPRSVNNLVDYDWLKGEMEATPDDGDAQRAGDPRWLRELSANAELVPVKKKKKTDHHDRCCREDEGAEKEEEKKEELMWVARDIAPFKWGHIDWEPAGSSAASSSSSSSSIHRSDDDNERNQVGPSNEPKYAPGEYEAVMALHRLRLRKETTPLLSSSGSEGEEEEEDCQSDGDAAMPTPLSGEWLAGRI
ncbi:hypothetical protein F4780DRAFT_781486 [Xylariomycetidae sp. FL0641]|nr:hypothetical protein F4780DRAFT_781486 [Xylariomycetidae sp. FL0641]